MPRHPPCALELLLLAWLAQIPSHCQWQLQGPGITSLSPSQVFLDYLSLIVTSLQLTTTTSKNTDRPARTARPVSHHPGNPTPAPAPPDHSGRCITVLSIASTTIQPHSVELRGLPDRCRDRLLAPGSVELRGLEPRTPCLQSRCSSQLSYSPSHLLTGIAPPDPPDKPAGMLQSTEL